MTDAHGLVSQPETVENRTSRIGEMGTKGFGVDTFLDHPGVPMTNNTAERALRPYVIWRKTSFFSQSHRGDCFRPMILSVVETCKRLKIGVYQTLRTICAQGMAEGEVTFRLPIPENRLLAGAGS